MKGGDRELGGLLAWGLESGSGFCVLIHSYIHSFIHSPIHSFIHSSTHSSPIHSFIHSLTHSPTQSLPHSLIYSLTHSFIHSYIHSLTHSLVRVLPLGQASWALTFQGPFLGSPHLMVILGSSFILPHWIQPHVSSHHLTPQNESKICPLLSPVLLCLIPVPISLSVLHILSCFIILLLLTV